MDDLLDAIFAMDVITGTRGVDGSCFIAMVTDCPVHGLDVHDVITASQN